MAMSTAGTPARPMRADARRNYGRLLAEARSAFAEHGTDASLEDVARRAGVGIGTLYRHFPTRHALMSAVFEEAVTSLITRSRDLAEAERPCAALVEWLGAIVTHAGEYRGLAQALMSTCRDESSALARCNTPLREAGSALLTRAQESGSVRADVSMDDLMQLTNAIALAAEQSPDDPELADRLLTLTLRGVRSTPSGKGRHPISSPADDHSSPAEDRSSPSGD
ncbi:helix-turn-helix domain containing protein [Streptomyces castrisilvae]|uniref:Helix-turn-helix domain containing protein n=2 Tax=Streptomyces castrisilvae TaxID=3033811 RepID=A0ABY9HMY1_9ACTN|nr:TetR/AcrR family transcriptional regulator [Streptomyces sp. Mut1]WLQ35903.1 helix-turn-helix domain containing protein [Streptomyces sp. Mut1]